MEIHLYRLCLAKYTDGFLTIDGRWFGYALELPKVHQGQENVPGLTCIPKGTYKLALTHSAAFGRTMPLVLDVPGPRRGIRFHGGNIPKDSRGCIIAASRKLAPGQVQGSLEHSLCEHIRKAGGEATLRILEAA